MKPEYCSFESSVMRSNNAVGLFALLVLLESTLRQLTLAQASSSFDGTPIRHYRRPVSIQAGGGWHAFAATTTKKPAMTTQANC